MKRVNVNARLADIRRSAIHCSPASCLLCALVWLWTAPALACKCMPLAPAESLEQAVAVFEGRVEEMVAPPVEQTGPMAQRRVRLRAVRAWKGVESETVEVMTATESAACGYTFTLHRSYLVYASAADGQLRVTSCSRTRDMAEAGEDLMVLGMGATPVDPKSPAAAARATKTARPPASGGCASCALAPRAGSNGAWFAIAAAIGILRLGRARRAPQRSYLPPKI
jgi:hypothetical protein